MNNNFPSNGQNINFQNNPDFYALECAFVAELLSLIKYHNGGELELVVKIHCLVNPRFETIALQLQGGKGGENLVKSFYLRGGGESAKNFPSQNLPESQVSSKLIPNKERKDLHNFVDDLGKLPQVKAKFPEYCHYHIWVAISNKIEELMELDSDIHQPAYDLESRFRDAKNSWEAAPESTAETKPTRPYILEADGKLALGWIAAKSVAIELVPGLQAVGKISLH